MDETKRSRCCSLRSAWTKKTSDIRLSDNGNCPACLAGPSICDRFVPEVPVDMQVYPHLLLFDYSAVFAHL